MIGRLPPRAVGLDFGCGPVTAMEHLFRGAGHSMASWDPLFLPDPAPLGATYDFITCSEVLEHVASPTELLDQLQRLLRPGGLLGVMTQFRDPNRPFPAWWYRRDPTHVCFYSRHTMSWIAKRRGWEVEFAPRCVSLFRLTGLTQPAGGP